MPTPENRRFVRWTALRWGAPVRWSELIAVGLLSGFLTFGCFVVLWHLDAERGGGPVEDLSVDDLKPSDVMLVRGRPGNFGGRPAPTSEGRAGEGARGTLQARLPWLVLLGSSCAGLFFWRRWRRAVAEQRSAILSVVQPGVIHAAHHRWAAGPHQTAVDGVAEQSGAGQPPASGAAPSSSTSVPSLVTIAAVGHQIANRSGPGGYRTMISGVNSRISVSRQARDLAETLAGLGLGVILLDWAPDGDGIAASAQVPVTPGLAELLAGTATFGQTVRRIPGSRVHMIAAGTFPLGRVMALDADRLNLVLDALDETYGHIIIAGRYAPARLLFEAIEGRIDCGVAISNGTAERAAEDDGRPRYLGFEVADIDLVRYEPDNSPIRTFASR